MTFVGGLNVSGVGAVPAQHVRLRVSITQRVTDLLLDT